MKQQTRTKKHEVRYKGYILVQVPWNSHERKQYGKFLYNPEGKVVLHAGYSKYCSHKELRLMIRNDVDYLLPMLMKSAEKRQNERKES